MTVDTPFTSKPDDSGALRAGRRIFGRYLMQRVLGRGGMGVVWLARDEKLDRLVALKFLPDVCFLDAASRDELKRETRRSLELTHPNIVRIYDFVEDEEAAAISMEYVDGATLSALRVEKEERCFEPADLGRWVADLCRALDYAHHGALFVHRDLKPGNLMLTARGQLKIADFGIACSLHNTAARISAWNSTGGTLGYMSPQQLAGELASPADDIYSVGALLYEMLTSKPPFYSGDLSLQIRTITPERIDERRRNLGITGAPIPAAWQETIAACLAKTPAERPGTATEIARRLGLDVEGCGGADRNPPEMLTIVGAGRSDPLPGAGSERPEKEPRTKLGNLPKYWLLGGAFAVALLVGVTGGALFNRQSAVTTTAIPAVAEVPALPAIAPGGIILKTEPAGAQVTVDADAAGISPVALKDIPAGTHTVEIQRAGFDPVALTAQVRPEQFTDLGVIALRRSTGTLQLVTEPQDSRYVLLAAEGDAVIREGFTPDSVPQLPTGDYRVRFERQGWPPQEQRVAITRDATRLTRHEFATSRLVVVTDPPGATVTLAERILGPTPLHTSLPNGRHGPFTATLPGHMPATFEVVLEPGQTTTLPPILLKAEPPVLRVVTFPAGAPFRLFAGATENPDAEPVGHGTTPASITDLAPGPYRVVFGDETWPARSMAIEFAERGISPIEITFPHGTVKVVSLPPGAEIFVGDESLGVAPLELPLTIGTHTLTAEYQDRTSRPRKITVAEDGNETVRFDFGTSSETTARKPRRGRKKKPEDSAFTKVGRSITNFFTGQKKK